MTFDRAQWMTKNKKNDKGYLDMFYKFLATASVVAMSSVSAQAGIDMLGGTTTATLYAVSEYEFRGVAFNDERATFQYGADWAHANNGFAAGVWASPAVIDGDEPSDHEVDFYVSYNNTLMNDKLSYGLTAWYFTYPTSENSDDLNYAEYYLDLGYQVHDMVNLGAQIAVSDDYYNTGQSQYYEGNATFSLPMDVTLKTGYGYQGIDNNAQYGVADYQNWYASVSKEIKGFNVGLKFIDTNEDACGDNCDERYVVSASYTF